MGFNIRDRETKGGVEVIPARVPGFGPLRSGNSFMKKKERNG